MAYLFLTNENSKQHTQVTIQKYQKAVECAKTFDWEDVGDTEPNAWPKNFKCKKTGITAKKTSENSPVMFVNDDLLLLTSDEINIRNILT